MKKLLLTEGLIACFFLALFLGFFGKYLGGGQEQVKWSAGKSSNEQQEGLTVYTGLLQEAFSPLNYQTKGEENVFLIFYPEMTRE